MGKFDTKSEKLATLRRLLTLAVGKIFFPREEIGIITPHIHLIGRCKISHFYLEYATFGG